MLNCSHYLRCAFLLGILSAITSFTQAQSDSLVNPLTIDQLIKDQSISEAKEELQKQVAYFKSVKNYDTLAYYVRYYGSYTLSGENWETALASAKSFVEELKAYNSASINAKALKELAWVYDETGQSKKAYNTLEEALDYASKLDQKKEYRTAELQYNLGFYASIMGDFPRSKKHYKESLKLVDQINSNDYAFYQQIYNALGGVMWNEAKMDSSLYYFNQSLAALKKTDSLPINQYYRPALLKMNLAIISHNMGNNTEAINFSKEAIRNFRNYRREGLDEQKKEAARKSQLAAIDNMGVFYNAVGEFNKAEELITYAYNKKKENLESTDVNIIISKIILAQAKINTKDLDGAEELLLEAIQISEDNPGSQLFWHASAYTTLGKVLALKGDTNRAKEYYEAGEKLQRSNLKGAFNKDFINELTEMMMFYAQNNEHQKAKRLIEEVYTFIKESSLKNTLQDINTTTTIARAYYEMGDYKEAIRYSDEVINYSLSKNKQTTLKKTDSILVQFSAPIALLVKAKSRYKLEKDPSEESLQQVLAIIEKGIGIVEQRKNTIESHDDISLLISQYNELFNFAKKLRLELYEMTKKEAYLEDVINLHESNLYQRIRSRLNIKNNIAFSDVPEQVLDREQTIRQRVSSSLKDSNTIDSFFTAQEQWRSFKDSLKQHFPRYYKMKFENVESSLSTIQKKIPDNTTVVRYLFIEESLYAFVISQSEKSILQLDATSLKNEVNHLTQNQHDVSKTCEVYHELYNQLWQPFASKITSDNLIIIPDAELFNLSFETLTSERVHSFKELATTSLLSKYVISYNYSLLLLEKDQKTLTYNTNMIAFTPEFSEKMKNEYKIAVKDSLEIDQSYLTLLPQPFSVSIAEDYSRIFKGDHFKNVHATKQFFVQEAGEHKIIHIGTHAESNNISPELSRLIFAKPTSQDQTLEDNSLYTYEIYNCNLSANLAILTACETGKPSFQSGEGMISLAHAFNYAGSESILTSLWKIDEQSSAIIVSYFYDNLKKGMRKDSALREAKLKYLSTAEGRTLQPNYWAGLVLMGDTSPLDLNSGLPWWVWILIAAVGLILIVLLAQKKTKQPSS